MTEAEWFACNDPCDLHDFLKEKLGIPRQGEISSRKLAAPRGRVLPHVSLTFSWMNGAATARTWRSN